MKKKVDNNNTNSKVDTANVKEEPKTQTEQEEYITEEDIVSAIDHEVVSEEEPSSDDSAYKTSTTIDSTILAYGKKSTRTFFKTGKNEHSCIDRFYPDAEQGLSNEQVGIRTAQGLTNESKASKGISYGSIFFNNIFTFFNMLTFAVFIVILIFIKDVSELSKLFFMIIVLINVSIGIVQEIKSKRATDRLKLVTAPTATVVRAGERMTIPTAEVVLDDVILFENGKQVCADSIVISGEVEVNESLLTGESEPVIKKEGMPLFSGSFIVGGACSARVDKVGSDNYVEKLSSYARRYKKPKSEMRSSVTAVIKSVAAFIIPIAIILLILGLRNVPVLNYETVGNVVGSVGGAIIGMIPSGMFLLTSIALYQSVLRLSKRKIVVKDLYCIEMLARVNVLCLDKTGTITDGTMKVSEVVDLGCQELKYSIDEIIGSMLVATGDNNMTALALSDRFGYSKSLRPVSVIPFSSQKKLSAVTFEGAGTFILGAPEFVLRDQPLKIQKQVNEYAANGMRVIMLAYSQSAIRDKNIPLVRKPVCLVAIEDHIRPEAPEIIKWFKENDVDVKIISGDNPVTVAEVAKRVGVENADKYISLDGLNSRQVDEAAMRYTVFGRVSPEQKCILIKALKRKGKNVAMTGDGVNDILAMRESDCAIAMGSGSDAARNVCHLLLTDSSFEAMPLVVKEGRRVVNNVQNSSALYLMKTFMSVVLSMISVVLALARVSTDIYFFDTRNLLALEFFIIGVPSVLLATQPNSNIIKGQFLANVFKKAVPCGIALVFTVMSIYLFDRSGILGLTEVEYTTLLVAGTLFTGFFALLRICEPFDTFKTVLCVSVFCVCVIALTGLVAITKLMYLDLFGNIVPLTSLGFSRITFLATIVFTSYFILALCDAILDRKSKKKEPFSVK